MSQHNEDRDKVVNALGGKKGLIDSGVPSIVFLVIFNVTKEINTAIWAALSVSLTLAIIRLIMKDTIQHSLSGLVGVAISAYIANRTGNPIDYFLTSLVKNSVQAVIYLVGNLIGWPILGIVLGPILGENFTWRKAPNRKKMYINVSWIWVGMFVARIVIQLPIYLANNVNLFGVVNLILGFPLFFLVGYFSWLVIKSGPPAVKVSD